MTYIKKLSESRIVCALAETVCRRVTRKVIRELQRMGPETCGGSLLSGEDSGLKTVWDEICVQVQGEESFSWGAYETTVASLVDGLAEELSDLEREAVWLQTPQGEDWYVDDEDQRNPYPVSNTDIEEYLRKLVLDAAADWTNPQIRTFLDRCYAQD